MFDHIGRVAEKVATGVSRRGFLGSLSGWAAAAAMGVAGVLTGARTAQAGNGTKGTCCTYLSAAFRIWVPKGTNCPPTCGGFVLSGATNAKCTSGECFDVISCNGCPF